MLFNTDDILETTRMITQNKLDVRTITMGISLRDCGHPDIKVTAQKIYDKICRKAEHLVKTRASTLSVRSQGRSTSVRPKWP